MSFCRTMTCFLLVLWCSVFTMGLCLVYAAHTELYPWKHSDGFEPGVIMEDRWYKSPIRPLFNVSFDARTDAYLMETFKTVPGTVLAVYLSSVTGFDFSERIHTMWFDERHEPPLSGDNSTDVLSGHTFVMGNITGEASQWIRVEVPLSQESTHVLSIRSPSTKTSGILIKIRQESPYIGPFLRYWVAAPASILCHRDLAWKGIFPFGPLFHRAWMPCPETPAGLHIGLSIVEGCVGMVGGAILGTLLVRSMSGRTLTLPWLGTIGPWPDYNTVDLGILEETEFFFHEWQHLAFHFLHAFFLYLHWNRDKVSSILRISLF